MVLRNKPGTYLLQLELKLEKSIRIGRLGVLSFPAGYYLYVGSAFGPGGLKARISRHLRPNKRCRWHIDYLRRHCHLAEIWVSESPITMECKWARFLSEHSRLSIPHASFGSSDCRCLSHLFFHPEYLDPQSFNLESIRYFKPSDWHG